MASIGDGPRSGTGRSVRWMNGVMATVYVVTGAAGQLGSTIVRALAARGSAVRALVRPGEAVPATVASAAEVVEGDITDRASLEPLFAGLEGRDVVVLHTAGIVSIGSATRAELLRVNVGGTANVARACLAHGVRRLVYVSSVHAIPASAGHGADDPIVETKDFDPALVSGDYAKSKAIVTRRVLGLVGRGLEIVVVHPSGFLGPFDRGRITSSSSSGFTGPAACPRPCAAASISPMSATSPMDAFAPPASEDRARPTSFPGTSRRSLNSLRLSAARCRSPFRGRWRRWPRPSRRRGAACAAPARSSPGTPSRRSARPRASPMRRRRVSSDIGSAGSPRPCGTRSATSRRRRGRRGRTPPRSHRAADEPVLAGPDLERAVAEVDLGARPRPRRCAAVARDSGGEFRPQAGLPFVVVHRRTGAPSRRGWDRGTMRGTTRRRRR